MSDQNILTPNFSTTFLIERIRAKQEQIHAWLRSHEKKVELPLYSSVDVRNAGYKVAVVDTNLFPAGFNNLCEHGIEDAKQFIKAAILKRVPGAKNILIVAEEHTRNTWYLENIRILQQIIESAGFQTRVATFLSVQPAFCESASSVELETATGQTVKIHCFNRILNKIKSNEAKYDLIIMNNDLSTGIPDILKEANIPIYPSIQAGWHARLKSRHFCHTGDLMEEFAELIGMDPWFFSCLYSVVDHADINVEADRKRLMAAAERLFRSIQEKYEQYKINEKPFIFVKADSGTYGMAVMPVEDPKELIELNRKDKNKLYRSKGSKVVTRYLLQEGVATIQTVEDMASEVCIYQIDNNVIGGFYRTNSEKGSRENLNSTGMEFKKMCPHSKKYGECGVRHDLNCFDVYRILARVAGIAAHREIVQLEKNSKEAEALSECE